MRNCDKACTFSDTVEVDRRHLAKPKCYTLNDLFACKNAKRKSSSENGQ